MTYTVASFFSGIGGLDLAFSWAGFDIRFQCEIDEYCQQVLKKWRPVYWQNATIKGDIKNVSKREVGEVDVIVGGFPCQDISIAGKRDGIKRGNRSGLWFELLRIIREVRPQVILLENVSAISVPVDGTAPGLIVIGTLAEIGYDCTWQFVRASDVDAPHQRERWFCVGYRTSIGSRAGRDYNARNFLQQQRYTSENQQERNRGKRKVRSSRQNSELSNTSNKRINRRVWKSRNATGGSAKRGQQRRAVNNGGIKNMVNTDSKRQQKQSEQEPVRTKLSGIKHGSRDPSRGRIKSRLGRTTHGVSSRLDRHRGRYPARPNEAQYDYEPPRVTGKRENRVNRIKALGNAVVPQQAYPFAMAIKQFLEATA